MAVAECFFSLVSATREIITGPVNIPQNTIHLIAANISTGCGDREP